MKTQSVKFNNTYTENFGGYITYYKLMFVGERCMLSQIKNVFNMIDLKLKIYLIFTLLYKVPFWIFIKPLGSLFSFKGTYNGNYNFSEDTSNFSYSVEKTILLKFIGIPIFIFFSSYLNKEDIQKISKLDADNLIIKKLV